MHSLGSLKTAAIVGTSPPLNAQDRKPIKEDLRQHPGTLVPEFRPNTEKAPFFIY
ncbi:MAG TPA: hypothetical protein VK666_08215 [Chryseolinea sp.]|nr:hypothetical protein [Chryseolinea sp.]